MKGRAMEMGEIVAVLAVGFALGAVVSGAIAYDQGFKAGLSWGLTRWARADATEKAST